jgi:hypothetical protein
MRTIRSLPIAAALILLAAVPRRAAAEGDGVALALVYDTSGSMKDPVRDGTGQPAPKFKIANRALEAIAKQIQTYATNSASGPRKIHAGLFVFNGSGTREVVKVGPFDEAAIVAWARSFSTPGSGTPLGTALDVASQAILKSNLSRKHVLVITDGINTVGPDPATVLPRLQKQAQLRQGDFSVHFVAFDVDAKVFAPLKKLGATVVGAADEKQLNTQLDFILQSKILLEDEEPVKKK